MVSVSLLPNPGIHSVIAEGEKDSEFVKAVLTEIRDRLRLPRGDNSTTTQSRIYSFLSEEISRVAFANVDLNKVRSRLGEKGELHPSQYEIRFIEEFTKFEYIGVRKSHAADAVTHPEHRTIVTTKYLKPPLNRVISTKTVTGKRSEDTFILLVISEPIGHVQLLRFACRVYLSDVNLSNVSEPLDVLREFIDTFGATFRLGNTKAKFLHNEIVSSFEHELGSSHIVLLDGSDSRQCAPFLTGGITHLHGTNNEKMFEIVLGFVANIARYVKALRRHHVHIAPEAGTVLDLDR